MTGLAPPPVRLPLTTKLAYGASSIAFGVKDNGFSVFLLLFYNQVVGLDAALVGLAALIALLLDAIVDPLVGHFSDRTRSRLGRRHPWLYLAVLPMTVMWYALWHPPVGASDALLFGYLLATAFLMRAAVSCYEVPAVAMTAELTSDYDERTAIFRWRFLFGWTGGLLILALAYGVLLVPQPGFPNGQLNPVGYDRYAIVGAVMILVSATLSALGTQKVMMTRVHPPLRRLAVRETLGEVREALSNRAFVILMAAAVFAFTNQGLTFALVNYLLTFVWLMPQSGFVIYAGSLFVGVIFAFLLVAPLQRRLGKQRAAVLAGLASLILGTLPYWLRVIDAFPGPQSSLLIPVLFAIITIANGLGVCVMILASSMMADVVEDSEQRTGRRDEGLFFAGYFFTQKCVTGIGIFLSGLIVNLAGLPENAVPGAVAELVLDRLSLLYASAIVVFGLISAVFFARFPITRADHEKRVAMLAVASHADPAPLPAGAASPGVEKAASA